MSPGVLVWRAGVAWDAVEGTDRRLVAALPADRPVLWVDPPLSVVHAARSGGPASVVRRGGLRQVAGNVTRLTVLAPPFARRQGVATLSDTLVARAVRRAVRRLGHDVAAQVHTTPGARFDPRVGGVRTYYATDDMVAGAGLMRTGAERVRREEERRVADADLLLAVSPEIVDRWGAAGAGAHVLPNGCDPDHYAHVDELPRPPGVHLTGPVAGVVGQLSARLDLALLEAVADRGVALLLVGPLDPAYEPERVGRLLARPTVQWVGRQDFADLPAYLGAIDVGLTPYADTAFNRASFPLKTLEYLSAGRAAVSTPLPAVDALGTDLVRVAATPEEFAAATTAALAKAGDLSAAARRRDFAAGHSWTLRAAELLRLVDEEGALSSASR